MIYLSNAYLATCVSLPFSYSICTRIYSTFCTTEIQLSTFYISTAFYKYVRDKAAAAAAPRTATQVQLLVARRALPGVCCCSRLTAHGSRLTAHGSRLTAHGSRLTAHRVESRRYSLEETPLDADTAARIYMVAFANGTLLSNCARASYIIS